MGSGHWPRGRRCGRVGSGCGTGRPRWSPQLCVHDNYRNNPFHNFRHCFCVAQMMYSMIWLCGLQVGPGPPGAGGSTPAQARGPPTPQTGPWVGLLHPPPTPQPLSTSKWVPRPLPHPRPGLEGHHPPTPPPSPTQPSPSPTPPASDPGEVFPNRHLDPDDGGHLPRPGSPRLQQHVRTCSSALFPLLKGTLGVPRGLGVRMQLFHCWGPGSAPGLGAEIPHQAAARRSHSK